MFDHLFTAGQRRARDWLREAAQRQLLGVRHPVQWGGRRTGLRVRRTP